MIARAGAGQITHLRLQRVAHDLDSCVIVVDGVATRRMEGAIRDEQVGKREVRRVRVAATARRDEAPRWLGRALASRGGAALALGMALALGACASGTTAPLPPNTLRLTDVPWCDTPSISFQDDAKLSHTVVTDWAAVKDQLDFTPYLPPSMPKGSCLALAGGTIHDPIFGGLFRITYYVPNSGPISFSEAPKHAGQSGSSAPQCTAAAPTATPAATPATTPTPALTVCLGTINTTNITVAAAQSTADMQKLFSSLQPTTDWVPQVKATPVATAQATKQP
jgi:hypothetical protein